MGIEQRDRPHETEKERLDRNLNELLGGLRVALPGIQVLFAFLLILPFQNRFAEVSNFQQKVYFVALIATALSSVALIASPVRHRIVFRRDEKHWVVFSGTRLVIGGVALLGVAILAVMLLVSDYLYGGLVAAITTAVVAVAMGWLWFGAAFARRRRSRP